MATTELRSEDATGNRHYNHPVTGDRLVSVTTVIEGTQDHPYLVPWAARLAAEYAADNTYRLAKLGREGFVDEVKREAERVRDIKKQVGTYAHDVVEALILWQSAGGGEIALPTLPEHLAGAFVDDLPIEDFVDIVLTGFVNFVHDHSPVFLASEMAVFNTELGIAGTLDLIVELPALGLTACVDTKTGKHLSNVREQLGAYRRMTECLLPMGQVEPMPATDSGLVLHLRPEYARGYRLMQVSTGDDFEAWNTFRRALMVYQDRAANRRKPGKVLYPPLPDGSQPPPLLADLDGEVHGRVTGPLIKAGLESVTDLAGFTAADLLAIKGIGPKSLESIAGLLAVHGLSLAQTTQEVA